jgi:hypothetical protein
MTAAAPLLEHSIHDHVWVKLTPYGEQVWTGYWSTVSQGVPPSVRFTDEQGRTRFQFWTLMAVFGGKMFVGGKEQVFEDNVVWI